jgi:hypothetical protein
MFIYYKRLIRVINNVSLHMPRGKGRKILPYRKAAAGRRPPPVAPRQVERQNL